MRPSHITFSQIEDSGTGANRRKSRFETAGDMEKRIPEHVAQVCRSGHVVLGSLKSFPQFRKSFCEDCGAPAIDQCQTCHWPIAGIGPNSWMGGGGRFKPPNYCGECGNPFPWTAAALSAAREYTDELDQLTQEEKDALKNTLIDLTTDTSRTPLAASRFKTVIRKIGPVAGNILQKIIENVLSEAAKRAIG
jgi:hypothetical protein